MNMVDKGEEVIKAYESNAATLKDQLAPKYGDKTFSIVRWAGNGPALILKELPAGQVLNDLGLKRPEAQDRNGQGHSEPVSLENLATMTRTTCSSAPSAAQARRTRTHRVPQVCRAPKSTE